MENPQPFAMTAFPKLPDFHLHNKKAAVRPLFGGLAAALFNLEISPRPLPRAYPSCGKRSERRHCPQDAQGEVPSSLCRPRR